MRSRVRQRKPKNASDVAVQERFSQTWRNKVSARVPLDIRCALQLRKSPRILSRPTHSFATLTGMSTRSLSASRSRCVIVRPNNSPQQFMHVTCWLRSIAYRSIATPLLISGAVDSTSRPHDAPNAVSKRIVVNVSTVGTTEKVPLLRATQKGRRHVVPPHLGPSDRPCMTLLTAALTAGRVRGRDGAACGMHSNNKLSSRR